MTTFAFIKKSDHQPLQENRRNAGKTLERVLRLKQEVHSHRHVNNTYDVSTDVIVATFEEVKQTTELVRKTKCHREAICTWIYVRTFLVSEFCLESLPWVIYYIMSWTWYLIIAITTKEYTERVLVTTLYEHFQYLQDFREFSCI